MRSSRSILQSAFLLGAGTIALVLFIAVTGDSRRQNNAMARARAHSEQLSSRIGESRQLPLNLSPPGASEVAAGASGLKCVSSADAYILRNVDGRLVVSWTIPIVQAIGLDGRAVVFFQNGEFSVSWVTLAEFSHLLQAQLATIERVHSGEKPGAP